MLFNNIYIPTTWFGQVLKLLPYVVYEYITHMFNKRDLNDSDNHDGVITHLEPEASEPGTDSGRASEQVFQG